MIFRDLLDNRLRIRLGIRQSHPVSHPSNDRQIMPSAIAELVSRESDRNEDAEILLQEFKIRRQHADDGILLIVEKQFAADNVALTAVAALPQAVGQHEHL